MPLSEEHIALHLAQTSRLQLSPETPYTSLISHDNPRFAAVLILFICRDNAWHVLFIRRSLKQNDRHGGQVAFPGGHCEPQDDNARATALREAHEEIGVKPEDVRILGQLRDVITITNFQVTPFVGVIPWPYTLSPQPEEVSRIFCIPLSWLIDPANREVRYRDILYQGQSIPVIHFSRYDNELLWGASARMIVLLLEALGISMPEERYKV
jgi:8-oxo-dGTP pyrophosphatase MutT (NUDIX family)